jgi:catechol 2,3-dioxygenase-like lactoylglutathione lyase family enzyme
MPMRMHHAAVVCGSEANADRFYQGILGLEKIKSSILGEALTEQIFGRAHECQIILYGNEYFAIEVFVTFLVQEKGSSFEHLCIEVENREEFLKKSESSGVSVKRIQKGDSLLAFIEDYDGNLFEVKE